MVDLLGLEGSGAVAELMAGLGRQARAAAAGLARSTGAQRNDALEAAATLLRRRAPAILAANAEDVAAARERDLSAALVDRLRLDPERVEAMAAGLEAIAALPDPLGRVLAEWTRPNGLVIRRVSVPLGVIGIIYESRPNVTADAGALCLKSGNAVILRGGSESFASSTQIHACLEEAVRSAGLPEAAIQMVPTRERAAVGELLGGLGGCVDVVVPRGGRGLIERVQRDARVPVIGHLEGVCHVYVDRAADLEMARRVVLNSKLRRPGICGAAETLLVESACAGTHLAPLLAALLDAGCEVRGDATAQAADARVRPAEPADWPREYLDAIIAVRVVDGLDEAMAHIARYGSGHTEAIVTADPARAARFLDQVDSAIVLHNASTQFADGGEFGMGAEIGISTGRIHARGPVGAEQLTSYKYQVRGAGQVRP
ncbi:glutamate-5-semialdehyde dehydrogenase [Thioalkalivibrio sp. XN8]|uniref:glutamate-5-semialdehyde dehydrogenase n=1 Tax=Thioalkalivibrio sp. XN8 TaxID=2712863 RepID=UPI001F0F893A|nr:glutamate-5-semialdehyde dehydrogenase [Thioalkalivibrio sp. XN8]